MGRRQADVADPASMGAEPVYGWEATMQEVDDWIFDDITRTFVLDCEMRQFFEEITLMRISRWGVKMGVVLGDA